MLTIYIQYISRLDIRFNQVHQHDFRSFLGPCFIPHTENARRGAPLDNALLASLAAERADLLDWMEDRGRFEAPLGVSWATHGEKPGVTDSWGARGF